MRNLVDLPHDPAVADAHRRGRILWGLAACMAEKGYQATTIADIARAARVSKTVVYVHFRDKEHCLLELYSRANDNVLATVREAQDAAGSAGLPWRERLGAGVRRVPRGAPARPPLARAALRAVPGPRPPAPGPRRWGICPFPDPLAEEAGQLARG